MSAEEVDEYLRGIEEPKQSTLQALRRTILEVIPDAEEVLGQLGDELEGYTMTKSALHFPVDRPLPKPLVEKLLEVRLAELR